MAILAGTQNAFEKALANLGRLGLGRAPNVLVSEYLAALVAEEVLDMASAKSIAAVYHRSRYGAIDPGDGEFLEAVSAFDHMTAKLEAMGGETRLKLAERVAAHLQPSAPAVGTLERHHSRLWQEPRTSTWWDTTQSRQFDQSAANDTDFGPDDDSAAGPGASATLTPKKGRGRISLAAAVIIAIGVFVAGYLVRDAMQARREMNLAQGQRALVNGLSPYDVWKHNRPWNQNVLRRAAYEYDTRNFERSRLAFELYLSGDPIDSDPNYAEALNQLAWLYLTEKEVHNPQRGFELGLRAVKAKRVPHILDTAAEGYFQNGNPEKAVTLEKEALDQLDQNRWVIRNADTARLKQILSAQLTKFERGRDSAKSASKTVAAPPLKTAPAASISPLRSSTQHSADVRK